MCDLYIRIMTAADGEVASEIRAVEFDVLFSILFLFDYNVVLTALSILYLNQ